MRPELGSEGLQVILGASHCGPFTDGKQVARVEQSSSAMLPALRAKDSVASQSQDSTKVSKRHSRAAEGVECVGRIMFLHVQDWKIL